MSRVPRIRFKGFEEDWEQRKLGEIAERIIRKNEKLESTLPLTISAQYGLIDQNEFFDKRIASKDVRGYYLIKKGEFAYNKSTSVDAPLGAIKRLDKYKNGVLSTLYILFKIIDDTSTSSDYLVTYYATDLWHRGIQSIAAEGARNHGLLNIAPNDFFETMLSIPFNISEQKKVGDFFITLDYLITLHQRKLEKLKIIKKSMLENLFPQNGEKTPKIRFSGFTKDWEQRKLGEIADKVVEKNFQLQERDVFTNSAEFGIIDQKNFFDHEIVNKNNIGGYYIVSPNDFVYNPRISVTAPVGPINRNKLCKRGIMSPLYTVFHPRNMNETFLEFYFRTNKWHKFMEYNGDSGARSDRFSIKTELFYAMTIPFPSHKEQSKVGICFESLDNLITLHQSKLDKLQKIKKSMLESMFV